MYLPEFDVIDNAFNFGGFPIKGLTYPEGDTDFLRLPITMRYVLSALWYAFFLALVVSPFLCVGNYFKSEVFYKKYTTFWWLGSFIFPLLTGVLSGLLPFVTSGIEPFLLKFYAIFYLIIIVIAMLPAYLQYKYYHRS